MSSFVDSLGQPWLALWTTFLGIGALGGWSFVVMYHFGTGGRWRHGRMGRHLMAMSIAVSQAITVYILRILFGDFPGRGALMFFTLILLISVVWWRTVMYVVEHRKERREEASREVV